MKFSDAIRAGAKITKPLFGDFFIDGSREQHACTTTAALIGVCGIEDYRGSRHLFMSSLALPRRLWPSLELPAIHPTQNSVGTVLSIVTVLNDVDMWPREDIADWIDNNYSHYDWESRPYDDAVEDYIQTTLMSEDMAMEGAI